MKKVLLTSLAFASAIFAAPTDSTSVSTKDSVQTQSQSDAQVAVPTAANQEALQQIASPVANNQAANEATPLANEKNNEPKQEAAKENAPLTENAVTANQEPTNEVASASVDSSASVANAENAPSDSNATQINATDKETSVASSDTSITNDVKANEEDVSKVQLQKPLENTEFVEEEIVYVKKKNKKLLETEKYSFDVLADFEIQAGKTLWITEDDANSDNLEEWTGKANLATVVETDNFMGVLALEFYPGDNLTTKEEKGSVNDYFKVKEAWAWQRTKYFNFKLGRWDNTDKNGDYFGGYVDGYLAGFRSSQESENQVQFGFTPSEFLAMNISLISTGEHLNSGDLRAQFSFHDLPSIELLKIDITYRSNIFDDVYASKSDIQHNVSFKGFLPIVKDRMGLFVEAALLGLDAQKEKLVTKTVKGKKYTSTKTVDADWYTPVTGGFSFETPVVDRIIVEAEYIHDRFNFERDRGIKSGKHVKDVLGALYLEKELTDRFTLSAGVHSFGSTKDWVINGNLVGRIN